MMLSKFIIISLLINSNISFAAEDVCETNSMIPSGLQSILNLIKKEKPPSKVKTSGAVMISKVDPVSKCGSDGKIQIKYTYKLPKSTSLQRAIEVYQDPNAINSIQKAYEDERSPYAKNVAVIKTGVNKDTYNLDGHTNIKFLFVNIGERNIRNKCKETKTDKTWSRTCDLDKTFKDGASIFGENSYTNSCEEKADGVTCFYTQTSVMKSQCGLANKSGMFIALTAAERSTSIQAALAEYIAQDAKTANAATAFASFQSSPADKSIVEFKAKQEDDIDKNPKIAHVIQ